MCIRDKIEDAKALNLERSFNARLAITKKGESYPIKAVSMHRSCSTPLWKVVLFMLSITVTMAMICCIIKKCKCKSECE